MYIYYILHGTQQEQEVEHEGDVSEELFPGVDLTEAVDVINAVTAYLQTQGVAGTWTSCNLIPSYTDHEDSYVYYNGNWRRRSEISLADIRNEQK
jgi:hypothetical protein